VSKDWVSSIVRGVDVDSLIRLGVALDGVYVTWYSKAGDIPQSTLGLAVVNDIVVVASVNTFWPAPAT